MRKGYLFIRTRTRHVAAKVVVASLSLAAIAAAAVPDHVARRPTSGQLSSMTSSAHEASKSAAHMTCVDFDNQAEAQAFLGNAGGRDSNRLDSDRDGIVCEGLP